MRAQVTESDAPFEGLRDKIDLMRRYYEESLRYPSVRSYAERMSMGADGHPSVEALFANMKGNLRYVPDPVGAELIKSPWTMVADIDSRGWSAGDCDDFAALAYTVLNSVGLRARLAVGWYGGNVNPTHIWTVLPDKFGGYLPFDLVAPHLGVTKQGVSNQVLYG